MNNLVFISYVKENRRRVERLCVGLRKRGVEVWLDKERLSPGRFWEDDIGEAIRTSLSFIACFSQQYWNKVITYMNEEITIALEKPAPDSTTRIPPFIPVKLTHCLIPNFRFPDGKAIENLQCVELYKNWEDGMDKIAAWVIRKSDQARASITTKVDERLTKSWLQENAIQWPEPWLRERTIRYMKQGHWYDDAYLDAIDELEDWHGMGWINSE